MNHTMTPRERSLYLLQKQAQVQVRLSLVLARITFDDVAAMSTIERERLRVVLDRLPVGILPTTYTHLREALAVAGVAA